MAVETGFMPGTDASVPVPTGVVTYLFTDVVGSTAAWERSADDMHEALRIHDEVIRALSAADIAFLLGYEETSSFYRAFQNWTGETPEETRSSLVIGR